MLILICLLFGGYWDEQIRSDDRGELVFVQFINGESLEVSKKCILDDRSNPLINLFYQQMEPNYNFRPFSLAVLKKIVVHFQNSRGDCRQFHMGILKIISNYIEAYEEFGSSSPVMLEATALIETLPHDHLGVPRFDFVQFQLNCNSIYNEISMRVSDDQKVRLQVARDLNLQVISQFLELLKRQRQKFRELYEEEPYSDWLGFLSQVFDIMGELQMVQISQLWTSIGTKKLESSPFTDFIRYGWAEYLAQLLIDRELAKEFGVEMQKFKIYAQEQKLEFEAFCNNMIDLMQHMDSDLYTLSNHDGNPRLTSK
eukprot:NODE_368_length_8682_cov_0.309915.p3 type:complete len:313 gc:universal NODE_368_length_8682_cov_0.309915:5797-4859(-)